MNLKSGYTHQSLFCRRGHEWDAWMFYDASDGLLHLVDSRDAYCPHCGLLEESRGAGRALIRLSRRTNRTYGIDHAAYLTFEDRVQAKVWESKAIRFGLWVLSFSVVCYGAGFLLSLVLEAAR